MAFVAFDKYGCCDVIQKQRAILEFLMCVDLSKARRIPYPVAQLTAGHKRQAEVDVQIFAIWHAMAGHCHLGIQIFQNKEYACDFNTELLFALVRRSVSSD
jgi:hypothetical protein